MKVLFHPKDHPWRTDSGYSIPARYLVNGLCRDLDLAVFAPVGGKYKIEYYFPDLGLIGTEEPSFTLVTDKDATCKHYNEELCGIEYVWDKVVPIYPGISEDYGEQIVDQHYQDFHAEILWQIGDVWALTRIPDLAEQDRVRWVIQPSLDFLDPLPDHFTHRLRSAMKVVPWVEEARERLVKAGVKNVADPIPLGLNTDLWKPVDRTKYSKTMGDLGFSYDAYNIAIVAANQIGRKAWTQALQAIKLFREVNPNAKVRLYLQTQINIGDGWPMDQMLAQLGLADITKTSRPYDMIIGRYTETQLMLIHALADVVINAGLEGFGYSTIQSQAVGTPVIGLAEGATKNLLECGMLVPPYTDMLTPNMLRRCEPHTTHIAEALQKIYEIPRNEFQKGPKFVQDNFAWPIVIEKWKKLFKEVDQELENKCIKTERYPPAPSDRELAMSKEMIEIV